MQYWIELYFKEYENETLIYTFAKYEKPNKSILKVYALC